MTSPNPLLEVENLATEFPPAAGRPAFRAVDGVSFSLAKGERLALVGESGSGKSLTVRSVLGLIPKPARIVAGSVRFRGQELTTLPPRTLARLRGGDMALVFQDPMTSWNPVKRIGAQIGEALPLHGKAKGWRAEVERLLGLVGIPAPAERARAFPHQFSGGMRQRAMIAMGVANAPALLIADEPTTALDVTVQDQVIRLLRQLSETSDVAILLITHNLALVANLCDRVMVMYAGRIVESGPADRLFEAPQHPYTWSLLRAIPSLAKSRHERLLSVRGNPLRSGEQVSGCKFHPRCPFKIERCASEEPPLVPDSADGAVRCWVTMRNVSDSQKAEA